MALPILMQKLFENSGAGPKIRSDILPEVEAGVMTINGEKPDGSGNFAIDVGVKTVNSLTPDDNGNVEVQTGHALGDTWISFDSTVPAGGVPFCGQLVSRDLWADLYAWATAQGKVKTESEWQEYATAHGGNCPYYSSGDNDTNFRMPKVSAYFKGAESVDEGGTWIAEGLPNITGSWTVDGNGLAAFSGAVYSNGAAAGADGASSNNLKAQLDASRSSSIYGNSSHVTPETCTVLVGVYAVGVASTVGSTDVDKIFSTVAALESNALAKSTPHIVEVFASDDRASWYRKWSDGFIEQGGFVLSALISTSDFTTCSLLTPMSTTTYTVVLTSYSYGTDLRAPTAKDKYTTAFTFQNIGGSEKRCNESVYWLASGY